MRDRIETLNLRHPITRIVPRNGAIIRLRDGRIGWVAGHAITAGKLTFVDRGAGRAWDLWPCEFEDFKEIHE